MNPGVFPVNTTQDEVANTPFTLRSGQSAVEGFLSDEPNLGMFTQAGYNKESLADVCEITELLYVEPTVELSPYTGGFLNFGEKSPNRRCEIHAVNTGNLSSWIHFAAIDPRQKIFSDHVITEIILGQPGIELSPLDIFTMAMFTRFGGSQGSEIQPYSDLHWRDDKMNISFLYPECDPRTHPLKTYQLGFKRFRNLALLSGEFDAYVRTIDEGNQKPKGRNRWLRFALPH